MIFKNKNSVLLTAFSRTALRGGVAMFCFVLIYVSSRLVTSSAFFRNLFFVHYFIVVRQDYIDQRASGKFWFRWRTYDK